MRTTHLRSRPVTVLARDRVSHSLSLFRSSPNRKRNRARHRRLLLWPPPRPPPRPAPPARRQLRSSSPLLRPPSTFPGSTTRAGSLSWAPSPATIRPSQPLRRPLKSLRRRRPTFMRWARSPRSAALLRVLRGTHASSRAAAQGSLKPGLCCSSGMRVSALLEGPHVLLSGR